MIDSKYRIAVLVDTSSGWGRRVIRGIANYGLKHGPWQISVDELGINEAMNLRPGWQGDGIIARVSNMKIYEELMALGKPIINVSNIELKGVDLPCVATDRNAVAQLAVQHFKERGFRNLAYCGPGELIYVKQLAKIFENLTQSMDLPCEVFQTKLKRRQNSREAERAELLSWVKNLANPVGIFAWGTRRGRDIINVCSEAGIAVPEQVAVLAGDDDELLCEVCDPTLSGTVTAAEQIGHEAARILDMLIQGGSTPSEAVQIAPTGIQIRGSTGSLAIEDSAVSRALQFIREHAHQPMHVNQIAEASGVSRRSLERRFNTTLGYSPARKIQNAHLERAQKLLKETDMSMVDIAAASGYGSPEYMIGIFKKSTNLTPLKYRTWVKGL